MARDHGRIFVNIWSDPDWIRLTERAQRTYILALSQPDLSYAGVLATRYRRWSGFAADSSVTKIRRSVAELETAGFVMTDDATEEMWIRTFVRHDGILTFPNVTKAMVKGFWAIQSPTIRDAFISELLDEFRRTGTKNERPKGWDIVFADPDDGGMGDAMAAAVAA